MDSTEACSEEIDTAITIVESCRLCNILLLGRLT